MGAEQDFVVVGEHAVRISNLDKVMFPATGTTKGEVIDYYRRIAPVMLPLVAGRPVTRKRWVDGVGTATHPNTPFFTKQLERGAPEWVTRVPQHHSTGIKEYPLVDDEATLVWLAQMASIELHVPQWRFDSGGDPDNPDRFVLDLDPGPGVGLVECAQVAALARDILTDMGLDPIPVTSGSKGIHLYAALPIDPAGSGLQSAEEITAVAKELATVIAHDHPGEVTAVMTRSKRGGKVFIDWSQNNASKTTVSPYSLRGRTHPWVAAPRTWDELADPGLRQLEFTEVLQRVEAHPGVLESYVSKRDQGRTPEPFPRPGPPGEDGDQTRFVIQEHHARRLHYDLRIERGGVLESWAVPKGVPETHEKNHLAIMTEPHPLEYLTFSGTIPKGNYGAGTMTVWDSGTVDLDKWTPSEVTGLFRGQPGGPLGQVRLAFIRTDGQGEKSSWLLHRMADQPAPAAEHAASPTSPMLAEPGTLAEAGRMGGWAEVKWDGIRVIGVWQEEALRLFSRNGVEVTERYPELTGPNAPGLPARNAVIDGEVVAFDARGRPSFTLLQHRMQVSDADQIARVAKRTPVGYQLFDLLSLDGADLTSRPLSERRVLLEALAGDLTGPIALPPVFDDLDEALRFSREQLLEGIVVKNPDSPYRPGVRSREWLKLKYLRHQEVVIIGMRPGTGARARTFGSLLLAVPEREGGLRYAGRVGTGFTDAALEHLSEELTELHTPHAPIEVPGADARGVLWVRPEVVGEVTFSEWTPSGRLRHPVWRGLRPDKAVDEIDPA